MKYLIEIPVSPEVEVKDMKSSTGQRVIALYNTAPWAIVDDDTEELLLESTPVLSVSVKANPQPCTNCGLPADNQCHRTDQIGPSWGDHKYKSE
jgi:hypothetical protein